VYEVLLSGADSFTKVNRDVAEHFARTIPDTGEFCMAMINMDLEDLDKSVFLCQMLPTLLKQWRSGERNEKHT